MCAVPARNSWKGSVVAQVAVLELVLVVPLPLPLPLSLLLAQALVVGALVVLVRLVSGQWLLVLPSMSLLVTPLELALVQVQVQVLQV